MAENNQNKKYRSWTFTLNNYTQDEENRLKELECVWMIFGHEHLDDEEKTPHLQGAVIFKGQRRLSTLHKLFPRAHWEQMRGTPQDNKTYCTKEDANYFESGLMPEKGKAGGEATKRKWAEAIELAENDDLETLKEKFPGWYVQNLNKFKQIAADAKKDKSMEDVTDNEIKKHFLWLCGPSGTGKSHTARRIARELDCEEPYLKGLNKWWNGYNHQKVTIIEEASPKACEYLASYFKQWCDKWSFTAECKGTVIAACRPEYIIVTSNYSIDTCFPEEADSEPLHRRFTEIVLSSREQYIYWPLTQAEKELQELQEVQEIASASPTQNEDEESGSDAPAGNTIPQEQPSQLERRETCADEDELLAELVNKG